MEAVVESPVWAWQWSFGVQLEMMRMLCTRCQSLRAAEHVGGGLQAFKSRLAPESRDIAVLRTVSHNDQSGTVSRESGPLDG